MAETIDALVVRIQADFDDLKKELDGASSKTSKSTKSMGKAFSNLTAEFRSNLNMVGRWAIGIAGAVTSLLSMKTVIDAMNAADGLAKTADRLGITVEGLSSLEFAADQAGVSASTLEMSLQRMTRRISEAALGMGEARDAIAELGLDAEQLAALPLEAQFKTIADAMKQVKTSADQTRLAFKLFDSEGAVLVNVLNEGSDGIERMQREADELGITMSRIDAAKIEIANDTFAKLQGLITGTARRLGAELAPLLTFMSNQFIAGAKNQQQLTDATEEFADFSLKALTTLEIAWTGLTSIWVGGKAAMAGLSLAFLKAAELGAMAAGIISTKFEQAWELIKAAAQLGAKAFELTWAQIKTGALRLIEEIGSRFSNFLIELGENTKFLEKVGVDVGAQMVAAGDQMADGLTRGREKAKEELDGLVSDVASATERVTKATSKLFLSLDTADFETPELSKIVAAADKTFAEAADQFNRTIDATLEEGTFSERLERNRVAFQEFKAFMEEEAELTAQQAQQRVEEEISLEEQRNKAILDQRRRLLDNLRRQEQQQQNQNVAIWESGFQGKAKIVSQVLGQVSKQMDSENRKMFEVGKAASLAKATIDTYTAANGAYAAMANIPYVGPVLGAIAAAAAVAAGVLNINRIRQTQFRGGGGVVGGTGSGASSLQSMLSQAGGGGVGGPETGGAVTNTTQFNVQLQGDSFGPNQVRALLNQIQDQTDDNLQIKTQVV